MGSVKKAFLAFEKMPLYIQIEVIQNHRVIYGDIIEISAYFSKFRRLWEDMAKRIHDNRFYSVDERMVLHRRWMHEKRAILGEIVYEDVLRGHNKERSNSFRFFVYWLNCKKKRIP